MKDVLVRYRVGSGEMGANGECRRPYARSIEGFLAATPQKKRDLEWALATGVIDRERYEKELDEIGKGDKINSEIAVVLSETSMLLKIRPFLNVRHGYNWRGQVVFAIFCCRPASPPAR